MRRYKLLALITMILICGSSIADEVYFSCNIVKGEVKLDNKQGVLRYTLNNKNKNEFIFKSKRNGFSGFNYNHYSRFQTDYFNVSFINANYKYTIFSNYQDERQSRGVSVTNLKSNKASVYNCKTVAIDRLSDLSELLACDTDSALGCE